MLIFVKYKNTIILFNHLSQNKKMIKSTSFRYLPPPLALDPNKVADKAAIDLSINAFKDTFFNVTPKVIENYAVVISKKMWLEMTHAFFNEADFIERDGVSINLGFDIDKSIIQLHFQGISTLKEPNGDDFVAATSALRIDQDSLSPVYVTGRQGGGASEPGPVGTSQIPPTPQN
jgi:hypothetical protein